MYSSRLIFYISLLLSILIYPNIVFSGHLHSEKYYQDIWCDKFGGETEVRINSVRCDCVTPEYAIEFDFAKKYHEAIGQALEYGILLKRKSAIVLIIESNKDYKYLIRLKKIIKYRNLDIKVFTITN